MLEFLILSAPRSASTWVSNWLTTEHTLCLHDPVLEHEPEALDHMPTDRTLGAACTGLALLPDWVNAHPARKVIIHRSIPQIDHSLMGIGLTPLSRAWDGALERLQGLHVHFNDLWHPQAAAVIYQHLTHRLFDQPRWELLKKMHVDPHFNRLPVNAARTRAFRDRIERALA